MSLTYRPNEWVLGLREKLSVYPRLVPRLNLIVTVTSYIRQHFLVYQVPCRAQLDKIFYSVMFWFSLNCSYTSGCVWNMKIRDLWKIYLNQTVGIHKEYA